MTRQHPDAGGAYSPPASRRPDDPRSGARRRPRWRLRAFLAAASLLSRAMDASAFLRAARRGPWRVEVAEASMAPALLPGDWLLVDPTCRRWPRPGCIVVVREPGSDNLVVKRVAGRGWRSAPQGHGSDARPEAPVPRSARDGDAAWLLGDAADRSIDSRRYGPVEVDALVGRAWFRYAPRRRLGALRPLR